MKWLLVACAIAGLACGGPRREGAPPQHVPAGPALPAPALVDPSARGAAYLTALGALIQPAWGQFLEDCRVRLPASHALNAPRLEAIAELVIGRDGAVASKRIAQPSGNGDFDRAVLGVLGDARPLPPPPVELASDDDQVHVRWLFARDRRQAGPATAQVMAIEFPLLGVIDGLLERGELDRAALRVAGARASEARRPVAAERVMIAVLREGLASSHGVVRRAAVEAIGRANVQVLARDVHALVLPTSDGDLRLAAIAAATTLRDPEAVAPLLVDYPAELENRLQVAITKTAGLVALGRAADATAAIRGALDGSRGSNAVALAALGQAPDPALAGKLAAWFARGDARVRAGVCSALPAAAPAGAPALILRGLRDADATVRATCATAAARPGRAPPSRALIRRLGELARDRDQAVRARAVAALGAIDPDHRPRSIDDPAPEVRIAAIPRASEAELRALAADRDAEVRAAALAQLAERAPELLESAAADPSPQVRRAAAAALTDDAALDRLAADDSPEVATAALIRLAARRGRAEVTAPLLARLAAAPPGGAERVRIALAWLLAR
ncbi:MAG: TonB family protein [Kofleriaceae bacterium]